MPELRIDNFTGGLTDKVLNPSPNQAEELVNFLPDEHGKLVRRSGIEFFNTANFQTPGGTNTVDRIFSTDTVSNLGIEQKAYFFYVDGLLYVTEDDGVNFTHVTGPTGGSLGMTTTMSISKFRDIFFLTDGNYNVILYKGTTDGGASVQWRLTAATLERPFNNVGDKDTLSVTPDVGGETRTWALIAAHEFTTVAGVTYRITSTPIFSNPDTATTTTGCTVTSIDKSNPQIHYPYAAGGFGQWELYRTAANSSAFGLVATAPMTGNSVSQGSVPDTARGVSLYTDSGETGDSGIYVGHTDYTGTERGITRVRESVITSNGVGWGISRNRNILRQSKPAQPFAWPLEFELGLSAGNLRALGNTNIYPVVFTNTSCHRIEGFLDATGVGSPTIKDISTTVGCINQQSIVNFDNQVFFASTDGFYVTDGFKTNMISQNIAKRYVRDWDLNEEGLWDTAVDVHAKRIFWLYRKVGNTEYRLVMFSVTKGGGFFEFDVPFFPTAIDFADGTLIIGDDNGYLHKFYTGTEEGDRPDGSSPKTYDIDLTNSATPSLAERPTHINYQYRTPPITFGVERGRKWVTKLVGVFSKLATNLSLGLKSYNDNTDDGREMTEVRNRETAPTTGLHIFKRFFPSGTLRCTAKQVEVYSKKQVIYNSDEYGTGTVNTAGPTLLTTGLKNFPNGPSSLDATPLLQFLVLENDDFVNEYRIVNVSNDTLTLDTLAGAVDGPGQKWRIVGYPRDEKVRMESLTINYEHLGDGHEGFQTTDTGEN